MFNPGETIAQQFTVPFVADQIDSVIVTYKQNNDVILIKKITSNFEEYIPDYVLNYSALEVPITEGTLCEHENKLYKSNQKIEIAEQWNNEHWDEIHKTRVLLTLSQGESLLFKEKSKYRIQLNVYMKDESRMASKEIIDSTGVQHYDTNIGDHIVDGTMPDVAEDHEVATEEETQTIIDGYIDQEGGET